MCRHWATYSRHDIKAAKILSITWKHKNVVGIGDDYDVKVDLLNNDTEVIQMTTIQFDGKWPQVGDYLVMTDHVLKVVPPRVFGERYERLC